MERVIENEKTRAQGDEFVRADAQDEQIVQLKQENARLRAQLNAQKGGK
jgi:uncharacterized small protein (DUF1192 family)